MPNPEFTFDPKTLRYRYKDGPKAGQFVAQTKISPDLIEAYTKQRQEALLTITESLFKGDINVSSWESLVAKELKVSHLSAYSIGKGGTDKLSQRDYGIVGYRLREEYQYLRGFSSDILSGKLSEAQIKQRLKLYLESLHSTYELGRTQAAIASGKRWERWIRNKSAESCDGCIFEENKGWVNINSLPRIGSKECLVNCRCYKDYSDSLTKPQDRLLISSFGWL